MGGSYLNPDLETEQNKTLLEINKINNKINK
jgi:hypothetical protein